MTLKLWKPISLKDKENSINESMKMDIAYETLSYRNESKSRSSMGCNTQTISA